MIFSDSFGIYQVFIKVYMKKAFLPLAGFRFLFMTYLALSNNYELIS